MRGDSVITLFTNEIQGREYRVRQQLIKDGYRLHKTRVDSWHCAAYGVGYMIMEIDRNIAVSGFTPHLYSDSLEDVETFTFGEVGFLVA